MKILFIAINNMGELTGGDTIWMNLQKHWENKADIAIYHNNKAKRTYFGEYSPIKPTVFNILKNTIKQLYLGIKNLPKEEFDYVYSVSDFYPDLLTALVYKLKHRKCMWIAGYYLVAPPVFAKNSPYKGLSRVKGMLYRLQQRLSLFLVNKLADIVFVTSEPDKRYFPHKKVVVVKGGVDLEEIKLVDEYIPLEIRKYDAIFIGRFHYQKGVLELLDIWKEVVRDMPEAKLCMIGDGPLMKQCLKKRFQLDLDSNIDFVGFKNGEEKYELIKNSRIVVHPATYDSGGMACAECMAFGLPAIGFDLPAYATYYPLGMYKAENKEMFKEAIINFLTNTWDYEKFSQEAKDFIWNEWNWGKRSEDIWNECMGCNT